MTKEITAVKARLAVLENKVLNLNSNNKKKEEQIKPSSLPVQVEANNGNRQLQSEFNLLLERCKLTNSDKCNGVLKALFPKVVERMQTADPLFKRMYNKPVYTGSYYEKLRIKDAGEFDINLVLNLPAKPCHIKIDASVMPPSYALLQLDHSVDDLGLTDGEKKSLKSFLEDGYVIPSKLMCWIQSVIDTAKLTDLKADTVKQIKLTASGPARTLLITLNDNTVISVDLVPVFCFRHPVWPKEVKNLRVALVNSVCEEKKNLYLVPKGYKPSHKQSAHEPTKKNMHRIWRMHFADIERSVLEDPKHLEARPVIKLLKLLRDAQNWSNIHSYFLKTLVLNDIAANPGKQWKQNLIPERLLEMLEILEDCLKKNDLRHFFFQTVNLFQYLGIKEAEGIKNRLQTIIKKIREKPDENEEPEAYRIWKRAFISLFIEKN